MRTGRIVDPNALACAEQHPNVSVVGDDVGKLFEASAAFLRERVHPDADHALPDVGQTHPNPVVGADGQAGPAKIDVHYGDAAKASPSARRAAIRRIDVIGSMTSAST